MKEALMTASMASMLDNFNRSNINLLLEMGYKVTLAANFDSAEDSSPPARIASFRAEMEALGCRVVQIDFSRKPANISGQIRSFRQLQALAAGQDFALVHCNSPICAAMTRLAFRKKRKTHGTRVIYTAHGFHFFRGAPVKNWLLYFPVEWVCARWTDILNTVNREDYRFAKRWLKAGQVVRLPGVGIDLEKFKPGSAELETDREIAREAVRRSLGISKNEKMLLSVGELSRNKNHESVIRALSELQNPVYRYYICGRGLLEEELKVLAKELNLEDQVIFLGYREDVADIYQAADLFIFPSLREGLPMALMEAMAAKTPVVCSDIRGNRELVPDKELRFNPQDAADIAGCIQRAFKSDLSETTERHLYYIKKYRIENVKVKMRKEYRITGPEETGEQRQGNGMDGRRNGTDQIVL